MPENLTTDNTWDHGSSIGHRIVIARKRNGLTKQFIWDERFDSRMDCRVGLRPPRNDNQQD
jgi:hypothetical protein